ncbi:ABC transporter permease [Okibacterium endophyticum]
MFATYLRRELVGRRKQTIIIAIGMALAIALVIVVNAVSAGIKDAQTSVLSSVYGVGTDVTVTATPTTPEDGEMGEGPGAFSFGAEEGTTTEDGTAEISESRLSADRGTTTFDQSLLDTVLGIDGVAAASATLALTNTTFDGELPEAGAMAESPEGDAARPEGGAGGFGGSSFNVESFTVIGVDLAGASVGPLSAVELDEGRSLSASDTGEQVAVLDANYATSAEIAIGDTIDIGGSDFEVVGTVASTSADAETAANVYISLDVAQALAEVDGQVSTISVQADSADAISQVKADLEAALPDSTVSTQEDLAAGVSGSLSSAASLIANLGTWLSLLVLAAAFLIAVLFTISGVTRRTREFGTLKAIGWSNRRIVGQVAGESTVQALIGGVIGVAVGLSAILIINAAAPTLSSATTTEAAGAGGMPDAVPEGAASGGFGAAQSSAAASVDVALNAPVTPSVLVIAAAIAIIGGLLAGAIGGWRASRLRPAAALRSVA